MRDERDPLDDCGAHGCIFALLRPGASWGGVGTNGGCEHIKGGPAEVLAMLRAAAARVASQRAELEAARAVVESWREAEPPFCRWQEAMHRDACAEAGRGLCSGCRTIAALARYDAAKAGKAVE